MVLGILFLAGCQNNESPSSSPSEQEPSASAGESVIDTYGYNSIPDFPVPDISPRKITYFNAMLGETTIIDDAGQIEQVLEILDKVEVSGVPTEKTDDVQLHQLISFYENIEDQEPAYSLYFLTDSMYIEANGVCSDVYPTPNWVNLGQDDDAKVNIQFIRLIDSWAQASWILPEDSSQSQG